MYRSFRCVSATKRPPIDILLRLKKKVSFAASDQDEARFERSRTYTVIDLQRRHLVLKVKSYDSNLRPDKALTNRVRHHTTRINTPIVQVLQINIYLRNL